MNKKLSTMLLTSACLLIATPAFADSGECTVDADCSNGYTCEEIGAETCPAIACPEGEECEQPECDSQVIMGCVPPPPEQCDPAQGASACGGGLVCVTYTFEACSGGGSTGGSGSVGGGTVEPGGDGTDSGNSMTGSDMGSDDGGEGSGDGMDEPAPDDEPDYSCMTEQESYCVPPYLAPCQADADCGGGFTCEADEICTDCAVGVTCSVDENGNEVCEEEPTDCESTCEPSGTKYCQLQEVSCTADSDCAQGLICETFEYGGGAAPCYVDEMGNTDCPEPEPAESESFCVPADWERWVGGYGHEEASGGGADYNDAVTNAGGRGEEDGWSLVDAEVSQDADGNAQDGDDIDADAGGCQSTGKSGNGLGFGLLAALGMMLGLRRRKK
jgi:MYXO-CTERM domain-containing protein